MGQTQKQNLEALGLSENLIFQLRNLIDGNQIRGDELKEISHKIYDIEIKLAYAWSFETNIETKEVAGGSSTNIHFGSNYSDFENHTRKIRNIIHTDKSIRAEFLGKFIDLGHQAFMTLNHTATIKVFDTFSYSYKCHKCSGESYEMCSCNNGRITCQVCLGHGNNPRYDDYKKMTVYDTCYACGGSGKVMCSSCGGSGRIMCQSCNGKKFFTQYRSISAVAKPSYVVNVSHELYGKVLTNFLNANSFQFLAERTFFEFVSHKSLDDNIESFIYRNDNFITELTFEIQGKSYICVAFANPPYAFIRPPIFDDIFADELALIADINKDGKVTTDEAHKFFKKYQGQPILDRTLVGIAKIRKNTDDDTSKVIKEQCQYFISDEVAKIIATFLNQCIDKVSPTYSKWTWIIGTFIFCIFFSVFSIQLAIYAAKEPALQSIKRAQSAELWGNSISQSTRIWENIVDIAPTFLQFCLMQFIYMFMLWLVWALILWCISSIITIFRRLKVPKEYRQKLRNKEANKKAMKFLFAFGLLIFTFSFAYGYLAIKNIAPKIENLIPNTLKDKICEINKTNSTIQLESISKMCYVKTPKSK